MATSAREAARAPRAPIAATRIVEIRLLGEFGALVGPVAVPESAWCRRRAMSLVKLLALAPARRLHREVVVDALWPQLPLADAVPRLHQCAHYARRALGGADAVVLRGSVVALCPDRDVTVDAEVFRRAGAAALAGLVDPGTPDLAAAAGPGAAVAAVPGAGRPGDDGSDPWAGSLSGRVVSLDRCVDRTLAARAADAYHGPLLPEDAAEPWTEPHREQLRQLYLRMLRAAGRWERLLLEDPADERAHLAIMRRHAARGERVEALRQFDRLAAVLRRELGAAPCQDALTLRAAVLGLSA
jgi:DNA-binding SARP family transcriptional activator